MTHDGFVDVMCMLAVAIAFVTAGFVLGYAVGKADVRNEAVAIGAAEFVETPNGGSAFVWLRKEKEKK